MNLLRAATTVGAFTAISRLLGFTRDILIAHGLGAGPLADCFFVAFKLPNFFRRLFAEGALNASFVPLFSSILEQNGKEEARLFAEQILSILLFCLLAFVTVMQISMPWVMHGLAPGFIGDSDKFDLTVALTRLTFPYLLLISLVSLMGGILNTLGRFAALAATPILLNLFMIAGILWLAQHTETAGHALAWSVTTAGILQLVWITAALKNAGLGLRLRWPRLTDRTSELLRLMLPGVIGAGVIQINLIVDIVLASFLPDGSVTFLYFADRVNQLPIGIVGVALGTALLPMLSRQIASGDTRAAEVSQNRAIELAMLLALPSAAAFLVSSDVIIKVLFGHGAFTAHAAVATGTALMAYSLGLPAYVLVKVLTPAYFARKDTKTPVRIALLCVFANLILNLVLMGPFQHIGLALATAMSAWLNTILLAYYLRKKSIFKIDSRIKKRVPRMFISSAIMAAGLWLLERVISESFVGEKIEQITALAILIITGVALYAIAAHFSGAIHLSEIKTLAMRRGNRSKRVDRTELSGR